MAKPNIGLPAPVVGWIYNHSRKNYWRLAKWYEIDDLVQDGLMVAYKCRERYGEDLDPQHFMALVKTAFYRHITELLRKMRGVDDRTKLDDLAGGGETAIDRLSAQNNDDSRDLSILVSELPEKLRRVVQFYFNGDLRKLRRALRVRLGGPDETWQERLERVTGFPIDEDFEVELRAYLWEREAGVV